MKIGLGKACAVGFAGLLAAVTVTATANAAPASAPLTRNAPTGTVTVKAGPHGALTVNVPQKQGATPALASAPTTSPAVTRQFVANGGTISCGSGYACAGVPYSNGAYVFKFYNYGGYSLSYWAGTGFFINHQTGGAAARWDNSSGSQLGCVSAGNTRNGINWNPAWRVRLTSNGC